MESYRDGAVSLGLRHPAFIYNIPSVKIHQLLYNIVILIDKFKSNNPLYDVRNLTVIDSIEEYSMKYVVQKLNE